MKKFLRHETALLLLLIALLGYARLVEPAFVTVEGQRKLLENLWEMAIVAVPMTLIILTGGIDLSVGSIMALSAVALGLGIERGWPPLLCAGLALVVGLAAGGLNGFFVTRVKVHPLLVTLATLATFRGLAEGISGVRPLPGFPDNLKGMFGDPMPALCFVAAAAVAIWYLNAMPGGVWLRATGFNETGARFSALPVDSLKLKLYALSGLAASLAAVLYVARRSTAQADIGVGLELDAITAVVLGGTSIFGGRGHIWGTVLGLLLIRETRDFVSFHWGHEEYISIVIGVLLVGSVLLNRLFEKD